MKYVVGVDVGGTYTKIGIVNEQGEIIKKNKINTLHKNGYDAWIDDIICTVKEMVSLEKIQALGIGAPNANYFKQIIDNAPNLPYKGTLTLKADIESSINKPVKMDNDANLAAYGEWKFGLAKDKNNFAVITLGTGLGSGIVVQGEMLYGFNGAAGELGHSIIEKEGRHCKCGRKGCLETYVSATGIVHTALEKGLNIKTAEDLYSLALNNNSIAIQCFEETGNYLGLALANLAAILSPQIIVLSGGLASSGNFILQPTISSFQKNLLFTLKNTCEIKLSNLNENESAIKGAAALAFTLV